MFSSVLKQVDVTHLFLLNILMIFNTSTPVQAIVVPFKDVSGHISRTY